MKCWNWSLVCIVISLIASVSSVLSGCSKETPAHVIVAEAIDAPQQRSVDRAPASAIAKSLDWAVETGKAEDGNYYSRIVDKKNGVICYSAISAGTGGAGISCVKQ